MSMQFDRDSMPLVNERDNWETRSLTLSARRAFEVTFTQELLSIMQLIVEEHFKTENKGSGGVSLQDFKNVVFFLYKDKRDNESFESLLLAYKAKDVQSHEVYLLVRKIQEILGTFFSKAVNNEFVPLKADGYWEQGTIRSFEMVKRGFGLKLNEPSLIMLGILESLSRRILRIEFEDSFVLSTFPISPLVILDLEQQNLVFQKSGDGGFLFSIKLEKNILQFNRLSTQEPLFLSGLNQFARWYMLLEMIKDDANPFLSVSDDYGYFDNSTSSVNYIFPVDTVVSDLHLDNGLSLNLPKAIGDDAVLTAILFKGNFTFQHCMVIYSAQGDKVTIVLPEDYNGGEEYVNNPDLPVSYLVAGDFVKIFATSPSSPVVVENPKLEGFADALSFEALISISEKDLISTFTIGMPEQVSRDEVIEPFLNKWVLVVGTGDDGLGKDKKDLCYHLASRLAQNGYGLITGGWQGVDKVISNTFCSVLEENGINASFRCRSYIERTNREVNPSSDVVQLDKSQDWYEETLNVAGALIIIGGAGGSYRAYKMALALGVPVVPIGGTGGDALKVFKEVKRNSNVLPAGFEELNRDVSLRKATRSMADLVMDMLAGFKFPESSISADAFKSLVEQIYNDTPGTVDDDLQKNRWGGRSFVDGKMLAAKVSSSLIPAFYDVRITLTLPADSRKEERVAFFIHDSFSKQVVYKKAVNGVAMTNQRAYESFTVGAFTEEGTKLELDLNEVEGYPKGFYYKSVSKEFKKEVEQLYEKKSVIVKDDLQKGRWGGQSERDGKKLSAKVEKIGTKSFKVSIELGNNTGDVEFSGEVAFFVHDSFGKEIRYKRTRGGFAKLELTAYESFALGAYTSDGTMLELDLQKVPGFPKAFYY